MQIERDVLRHNLTHVMAGSIVMPPTYLVLDLETTNPDPASGQIWQIGFYPVIDSRPSYDRGTSIYVKQPRTVLAKADFEIEHRAQRSGTTTDAARQAFIAEVESRGVEPQQALTVAAALIDTFIRSRHYLVGQNFVKFDIPMFNYSCLQHGVGAVSFPKSQLIDIGMLIKSGLTRRRALSYEAPRDFYYRVSEERSRCRWSLERAVVPHFKLVEKYGVDISQAHDAGYDCWITAVALQEIITYAAAEDDLTY